MSSNLHALNYVIRHLFMALLGLRSDRFHIFASKNTLNAHCARVHCWFTHLIKNRNQFFAGPNFSGAQHKTRPPKKTRRTRKLKYNGAIFLQSFTVIIQQNHVECVGHRAQIDCIELSVVQRSHKYGSTQPL